MSKQIRAIETVYDGYRFRAKELPQKPKKEMSKKADRTGQRFGRLLAIECLGIAGAGYRWWGCVCDCGATVAVRSRELDRRHTRSCGCLQRENRATYGGAAGSNILPYGFASRNELLASYQKSARDREIEWGLSKREFCDIIAEPCVYCGSQASSVRKPNAQVNGEFVYSGIDRIDNSKGYIPGNVVSCCWVCNRAKSTMGLHDFLGWCRTLIAYSAARQARFEHGESPGRRG